MFEPKIETFIRCCTMQKTVCRLNADATIVRFLIKNGADVKLRTQEGETAMIMLGRSQKPHNIVEEVLIELISNGANIDECDNRGCTALHNAALNLSNPEIIRAFIKHGANLEKRNNIQISPVEQIFHSTKDAAIVEACLKLLPNAKGLFFPFITNRRMADFSGSWNQKNVEEAKRLMAEAGYTNGEGFPVLEFFITFSNDIPMFEAVQNMWKVNLGIDVKLTQMEFAP